MAGSVRVVGLRELRRTLRKAGRDMSDLKAAHATVARMMASASKLTAPFRTGRLAGSIRGNRAVGSAIVRAGSAKLPYANPVHWGWPARNIPANPWILKTVERERPIWIPVYAADLQHILNTIKGAPAP